MALPDSIRGTHHANRNSLSGIVPDRVRALVGDEGGATAVIVAILFPVLLGGMGLGAEASYWYVTQRKLQHAADVAAHAAGIRMRNGDTKAGIDAAALHIAREAGLSTSTGLITVNMPPTSGVFAGKSDSIEVLVSEIQPRLFSSFFGSGDLTLGARAVISLKMLTQACVLALSPTESGAVTVAGSTTVTLSGCDVASNSNASDALDMRGGGRLTTDCAYTVGEANVSTSLVLKNCDAVKENAPTVRDPYADIEEPVTGPDCKPNTVTASTRWDYSQRLPNGADYFRFCPGGLTVNGTVTFRQNTLYIIDGGVFQANDNSELKGSGVTFYFMNGASLHFNGRSKIDFSAPTSGPYSGLLFFGERDSTAVENLVNGASGSSFDGAIYFPSSAVQYSGANALSGCTQIIAETVEFTGNSNVMSDCTASGTRPVVTSQSLKLAE